MITGKTLLDDTNFFSRNDYKKNGQKIYSTVKTNMVKENGSLDFRLKKINETRNYLLDEIKHDDLKSEKHKNMCRTLNYFEHFLASISAFALLIGVSVGIASSAVGLKICAITEGIKKFKSIIKKKRKKE